MRKNCDDVHSHGIDRMCKCLFARLDADKTIEHAFFFVAVFSNMLFVCCDDSV